MEYEVRFYFPRSELNSLTARLKSQQTLKAGNRRYEKTMQFDHPCKKMSFYSKEIDGRFRIRLTKDSAASTCKISWKRRLPSTASTNVNQEEEIEVDVYGDDYNNLLFLLEKVLKMPLRESYERYRTLFSNAAIVISVDKYPFGVALEIESQSHSHDQKATRAVQHWTKKLGLDITKAYRLSWDDKYSELCREQGVEHYDHVTFDLPMPQIGG